MTALGIVKTARISCTTFARDVGHGLLEVGHNGLALVGLVVICALLFIAGAGNLGPQVESATLDWLLERHEARAESQGDLLAGLAEPNAVARATAADPKELNRQQAAVANWLSRRYRVAPEPVSRLVQEAWQIGEKAQLDPTLILAIMAVESSFNPFAQSKVGAQGLMQVMTHIHDDKYVVFGGNHAAFDPVTNLRVGVQVLKECIRRAGSIERGLKFYVGAANLDDDGGYAAKVLGEQSHLRLVAAGRSVALTVPQAAAVRADAVPVVVPEAGEQPPAIGRRDAGADRVALLR